MEPTGSSESAKRDRIPVKDHRKVRANETGGVSDVEGAEEPGSIGPSGPSESEQAPDVDSVRAEAAGYLDDLQRLKADFDNYRKRVLKEQTELLERGSVGLIARLLSVLDNFSLAVDAAEETHDFDRMLKGVEMVFGELNEVLRGEGLDEIRAKDEDFDPHMHEAAVQVPGDGSGELVVEEILRPGYTFKGKVLRPAMVKVTQRARSEHGSTGEMNGSDG